MDTITIVSSFVAFIGSVAALAWWLHHKSERDALRWVKSTHVDVVHLNVEKRGAEYAAADERPPHAVRLQS